MIVVKLYPKDTSRMTEVGALEFYGVPLGQSDGSAIEPDSLGALRPGQVKLFPTRIATVAEMRTITEALSRNEVRGEAGRYEWHAE